jgi:hypothetical protein
VEKAEQDYTDLLVAEAAVAVEQADQALTVEDKDVETILVHQEKAHLRTQAQEVDAEETVDLESASLLIGLKQQLN